LANKNNKKNKKSIGRIRILSEEELAIIPYKTNSYLQKILALETEIFLMGLRKRYASPSEWEGLDENIKKAEKEQRVNWHMFLMEWDGSGATNG